MQINFPSELLSRRRCERWRLFYFWQLQSNSTPVLPTILPVPPHFLHFLRRSRHGGISLSSVGEIVATSSSAVCGDPDVPFLRWLRASTSFCNDDGPSDLGSVGGLNDLVVNLGRGVLG
jgi:hypothetical protein